jgi:hypothetical protein
MRDRLVYITGKRAFVQWLDGNQLHGLAAQLAAPQFHALRHRRCHKRK